MNIKELKQYIEKELHTKRFLQDGLNTVTLFEEAEARYDDVLRMTTAAEKELASLAKEIKVTTDTLEALKVSASEQAAVANTIVDKASEQARKIVEQAQYDASELMKATDETLKSVKTAIKERCADRAAVQLEIDQLQKTRDTMLVEVEKLRRKFS